MNFGFNSNVRVGETLYHVQTEDRGPSHPFLDTVVYEAGRVIYKKSTSYADLVALAKTESISKQLREQLAQQHRDVIAELEAGTLPLNSLPNSHPVTKPEPTMDGLDIRLINPKTWFASGQATLEIELRQRSTGRETGGADIDVFLEREKVRIPCIQARADATGHATLSFQMPATAGEGISLVIRATDGVLYGELRFLLKAKPRDPALAPASK
jgi:hypothetical protein